MSKPTQLSDKHWKILSLMNDPNRTIKSIADEVGLSSDYLYDLINGNVKKAGKVAELFEAEVRKIDTKTSSRIKSLMKQNKFVALSLINSILKNFSLQKNYDLEEAKVIAQISGHLFKAPNVEIGSVSYSYTKGLSAEELVHEYNRLQTIANGPSNRGAVQESFERRPGILLDSVEQRGGVEEFDEDSQLPTDGEAA